MTAQSNTETIITLPPDILGHIADALGANWSYTVPRRTLQALSLTCTFMVPICRRYLFSKVGFGYSENYNERKDLREWRNGRNEFLLTQPTITSHYVKFLEVDTMLKFSTSDYDLLKIIRDTSPLTSVTISSSFSWDRIIEKKKTIVLSLLQKPIETLQIHGDQLEDWLVGIGSSLTANPQPRLRSVTLDLGEFDEENDEMILDELNSDLRQLSEKNILEVLKLQMTIKVYQDSEPIKYFTEWAADFDEILTDFGAFPALREVIVDLTWFTRDTAELCYDSRSADELTKAQFPRLLESRVIDFRYFFDWDSY
ncbi:hypothetical protein HYPSUDRAFT_49604 [Hypholoma sublateritium FD-334 SS-4]|uniref:F-box domain-containing protein n=1 Tax=Hypholoma sublateritium (strain FD-334 SS-4) TaxID=945553 RepID=A0A0D2KGW7_HYPSF|nr:hypothetical protein HYPSUDRAFT_49604 [Hypholoma sublateritium FD-334 SS-4]